MSYVDNSSSYNYQNQAALDQAAAVRKAVTAGTESTENTTPTKKVDAAEIATGSKEESVKVEINTNLNRDAKTAEFMDSLKNAISEIAKNQKASQTNDEQLSTLNDIKNALKQAQMNELFGTSEEVKSFEEIADKMRELKEDKSADNSSSSTDDSVSSMLEKLGLNDLAKALSNDGGGITAENIGSFIKDVEAAINAVGKEKESNDNAIQTQSDRVLEESRKLRESMGYGDEQLAKMRETDMAKESQDFTKQNVASQAGSLAQSQSANANQVDKNKM